MAERLDRLEDALDEAVQTAPEPMRTVIAALQALRGIAQVSATTIVAELSQVSRFGRASATHELQRHGGQRALQRRPDAPRRHYQDRQCAPAAHRDRGGLGVPTPSGPEAALLKRQQPVSEEVKAIAWKAQHRLHARYRTLTARGKSKQQVVTAVGRELLGFIWAIGTTVETAAGRARPVAA